MVNIKPETRARIQRYLRSNNEDPIILSHVAKAWKVSRQAVAKIRPAIVEEAEKVGRRVATGPEARRQGVQKAAEGKRRRTGTAVRALAHNGVTPDRIARLLGKHLNTVRRHLRQGRDD